MTADAELHDQVAAMIASLPDDAPVVLPKAWVQRLIEGVRSGTADPDWVDATSLASIIGLAPRWLIRHATELPFARRVAGARKIMFDVKAARRWMQTRPGP